MGHDMVSGIQGRRGKPDAAGRGLDVDMDGNLHVDSAPRRSEKAFRGEVGRRAGAACGRKMKIKPTTVADNALDFLIAYAAENRGTIAALTERLIQRTGQQIFRQQ